MKIKGFHLKLKLYCLIKNILKKNQMKCLVNYFFIILIINLYGTKLLLYFLYMEIVFR